MAQTSPAISRRRLGARLRRLREAKGVTGEEAGKAIRSSASKISRMESGAVPFKLRDVADLLTLYGLRSGSGRQVILSLVAETHEPGWWDHFGDVLPTWEKPYVGLEAGADLIQVYEPSAVPALLQTEAYALAALNVLDRAAAAGWRGRLAMTRRMRQDRLTSPDSPRLWALLDEAVLRYPVGGAEVMPAQIGHLIEMSRLANVTLQVIRLGAGRIPAAGSFTVLRFGDADLPDIVYLEHLTGASYLDRRADVEVYLEAWERITLAAEPPASTAHILCAIRDSWEGAITSGRRRPGPFGIASG